MCLCTELHIYMVNNIRAGLILSLSDRPKIKHIVQSMISQLYLPKCSYILVQGFIL